MKEPITVSVKVDAPLFRSFAVFDVFTVKQRWKMPLLFMIIMLGFSIVCYSGYRSNEQAVLIGSVLLVIGFGLPAAYYFNFQKSIKQQIARLGLETPQEVYRITVSEDGIHVQMKNGQAQDFPWNDLYGIYHKDSCTYLYIQQNRAYLMPDQDVGDQLETLWTLFRSYADENKLFYK